METTLKNVMLLIDGDNIESAYAEQMLAVAKKFGRVADIHLFANFTKTNGKGKSWDIVIDKYAMEAHHSPSLTKQKNSADIRLMLFLMSCLYKRTDIDTYIIAANDNDYNPVVVEVHHFGKTAVNLYTDKKRSDKLLAVYDDRILIDLTKPITTDFAYTTESAYSQNSQKAEQAEPSKPEKSATTERLERPERSEKSEKTEKPIGNTTESNKQKESKDSYEELVKTTHFLIEKGLKNQETYSLSDLANHLRTKLKKFSVKNSYKTRYSTFKKFLTALMQDYPETFQSYTIETDNIKRR